MKLSGLLALIVLSACAAAPAALKTPWTVEVRTSGGIAGHGMGSFAVSSDGTVKVVKPNLDECSFQLTEGELARIETLLASTRRKAWKASYSPENACCDRFHFALTVDEAGRETKTQWITSPLPMPADLAELANAIVDGKESIRVMADDRCK